MPMSYQERLDDIIDTTIEEEGSDIHLTYGRPPTIRVSSYLVPLSKKPELSHDDIEAMIDEILGEEEKRELVDQRSVDFAYTHQKSEARFRGNAYYQRGKLGLALRLIPREIRTLQELNVPSQLESFTESKQGFFLVVGPTGHGKSTTLATLINLINQTRLEHILTIEDPIEYVHEEEKSIIDQREIGEDAVDFPTALKHVFRQDADVLMVGEMRDPETMRTAVTAAETGHLVYSTLHTNTAAQTIDRIIDSFPSDQQGQIRQQLAGSLTGVFSQRLIPRTSGGLVPAYELLVANSAVKNLIREGRTHELSTVIETSAQEGMIDMNRTLAQLVSQGEISVENAYRYTTNSKTLKKLL